MSDYEKVLKRYQFRKEDLSQYKSGKKYYNEVQNEKMLFDKFKEQEEYLKTFNFHEDLPRVSQFGYGMHKRLEFITTYFQLGAIGVFVLGKVFANNYYGQYVSPSRIRRSRALNFLFITVVGLFIIPTHIAFTPQNSNEWTPEFVDRKMYRKLDLDYNLYQNVDKVIYEDEGPTWEEFKLVHNTVYQRGLNKIKV